MPTLRSETEADIPAISEVNRAAFGQDDEADLVNALRADGLLSMSLVAELDGKIVGHLAMSPVTVNGQPTSGWGLAPMSVDPGYQRRGVGMRLATEALQRCADEGVGFVVVVGDPVYYSRFGFEPAAQHGLTCKFGNGEAFRIIELDEGAMPTGGGTIEYAAPFDKIA